jgi:hypothetical protein
MNETKYSAVQRFSLYEAIMLRNIKTEEEKIRHLIACKEKLICQLLIVPTHLGSSPLSHKSKDSKELRLDWEYASALLECQQI